jgi:hypothetical protein
LDESIEPWALAGFVHRCSSSAANTAHNTTCSFCQDRYQYVQCVMSNHLIPEPQTEAAADKTYFRQDREFFQMRGCCRKSFTITGTRGSWTTSLTKSKAPSACSRSRRTLPENPAKSAPTSTETFTTSASRLLD